MEHCNIIGVTATYQESVHVICDVDYHKSKKVYEYDTWCDIDSWAQGSGCTCE